MSKKLFVTLLGVLFCQLASAESQLTSPPYPPHYPPPPPPHGESCRLNYPGQTDFSGRRCINQNAFSVTYQGYFFSDAPCFTDVNQAEMAMRNEYVCRRPSNHGY